MVECLVQYTSKHMNAFFLLIIYILHNLNEVEIEIHTCTVTVNSPDFSVGIEYFCNKQTLRIRLNTNRKLNR